MDPLLVKKQPYFGQAADVWACGVILFTLLTGRLPYLAEFEADLFRKIQFAKYQYPRNFRQGSTHVSSTLSSSVKHLIKKIFEPNTSMRPTAEDILKHEWMNTDYIYLARDKRGNSKDEYNSQSNSYCATKNNPLLLKKQVRSELVNNESNIIKIKIFDSENSIKGHKILKQNYDVKNEDKQQTKEDSEPEEQLDTVQRNYFYTQPQDEEII